MAAPCKGCDLRPTQIKGWKQLLPEHAAEVLGSNTSPTAADFVPLHANIGQLVQGSDF